MKYSAQATFLVEREVEVEASSLEEARKKMEQCEFLREGPDVDCHFEELISEPTECD